MEMLLMQEGFNKILVLVNFSQSSLHAAEEAAMITEKFNGELHLLHVLSNSSRSFLLAPEAYFFHVAEEDKQATRSNMIRLEELKNDLGTRYGIKILCHEANGSLSDMTSKYVHNIHIDLVVLGATRKNRIKEFFFASKAKNIIKNVDSEVLCVYPESNSKRLKKIVLPVGKFIPKRKIKLAYELAKKFAANIHLISLSKTMSKDAGEATKILMASYQYLKDITNIPIECRTVPGDNLAQATIRYAENIDADLILVNSGDESHLANAVLRNWGGDIVNHSSIAVLSVHPISDKIKNRKYRA